MKREIVVDYTLKEKEFYEVYYNILNLDKGPKEKLRNQQVDLAVILSMKPLSFRLMTNESHNLPNSPKGTIADEMGIRRNSVSNLLSDLVVHGILTISEDEEIVFNSGIQELRRVIKTSIKEDDFSFNYSLNFKIKKNE